MDYKDNDGLITMADENGIFKVYAKGVQKETSKNRRLFLPFSLTRIAYDPKYSRDFLFLNQRTGDRVVLEKFVIARIPVHPTRS